MSRRGVAEVTEEEPLDVFGVGIGPFNLSLAALAEGVEDVRAEFCEQRPTFSWHPGLLLEGTTLQVPFLADLVTLVDPTSPWSYLAYLRDRQRLFPFYFAERFHVPRREYDDYCRWVASSLPSCRFGARVEAVRWDSEADAFGVSWRTISDGRRHRALARNVVLGLGTEPAVPAAFADLLGKEVFHAAAYLDNREALAEASDVTVVGSGQSGAEVFLDLLRAQPDTGHALRWLTRSPAFAPMEYSKLGLEHFTPDYVAYFRALPAEIRDRLVPAQWQLHKAISGETIAAVYDLLYERTVAGGRVDATLMPNVAVDGARRDGHGYVLSCRQMQQGYDLDVHTDRVVLATGYTPRPPTLLEPMADLVVRDTAGRFVVDGDYRVACAPEVGGGLFVQNAETPTHGVGTPDLGLGAWRAATILNAVVGRKVHELPTATAFTSFGV